jgi:hypothetical protein
MTSSDNDDQRESNNPYAPLLYDSSGDNADGVDAISHGGASPKAKSYGGDDGDAGDDTPPEPKL